MNYVRSSNKSHGKQNQIEGAKSEGKKVVVIEDLISTGGSSVTAVEALKTSRCRSIRCCSYLYLRFETSR